MTSPDNLDSLIALAEATTDCSRILIRARQKFDKLSQAVSQHPYQEGPGYFQRIREMQTQLEEWSREVKRMLPH